MGYCIGDIVRIKNHPSVDTFDVGDYELGDVATVEAIELNNGRIWYELNVELFCEDQALWCEEDLELVQSVDTTAAFRPGDTVVLNTEDGQRTATIGRMQMEYIPEEGECLIYYPSKHERPDPSKGYTEGALNAETTYTLF